MSPAGKIVEQTDTAAGYPTVDGCELLSPSVGTQIAVDTAYETRRESLLELLAVLDERGIWQRWMPSIWERRPIFLWTIWTALR